MSEPIIQVDCASCGTTYRLALPKVLVNKPNKSMSFRCNNCSYKFQILPKEILNQSAVAKTLILVESGDRLYVPSDMNELKDRIEDGIYRAEDLIRLYGKEWIEMGDEPTLAEFFSKRPTDGSKIIDYFSRDENPQIFSALQSVLSNNENSSVEKIFAQLDSETRSKIAKAIIDYCNVKPTMFDDIFTEALKPIIEKMLNEQYNY